MKNILMAVLGALSLTAVLQTQPAPAAESSWKAGVAAVSITPGKSVWMAGYAARKKPSEGALHELYARALALEDESGRRAVLVATDLLGFPGAVAARIARRVRERYRIPRERLVLNSSHTHGGPVVGDEMRVTYEGMSEEQWADARAYTTDLEDRVVRCVGAALEELKPARLRFGRTRAGFAGNRRLALNPHGPVDHDVPVLRVDGQNGDLRAVVFTYACHNTTLGGDMCQLHGDYAGFAQERLEKQRAGAKALYIAGCGGDANPTPRGKLEHAQQYGNELARAVHEALDGPLRTLSGPLRCAYDVVSVKFAPAPSREEWEARLKDSSIYVQRHARDMLKILDGGGRLRTEYPCPVQVWQFGQDLTFIPLAGEVVVDYALRLKKELGAEQLWVAGYSNDVFAYIPSERVLNEGGYEGGGAMIYYGQPGPFAPGVEETIIRKVHELVRRTQ